MIWGSGKLKKLIAEGKIRNTYDGCVNPASVNVRLGHSYLVPVGNKDSRTYEVALGDEIEYYMIDVYKSGGRIYMEPGKFILATTMEYVEVPKDAAVFVQGRSSIGRAGLTVQNAGFVDPGFPGCITLELKNDAPYPIVLVPGYPVAQLVYMDASDVEEGYSGKYCGQVEATGSRMYLDTNKGIGGDDDDQD